MPDDREQDLDDAPLERETSEDEVIADEGVEDLDETDDLDEDDLDEDDLDEDDLDEATRRGEYAGHGPRGQRLATWLLGAGGAVWTLVAVLRCAEPPAGPSLTVPPAESADDVERAPSEPAQAEPVAARPKPSEASPADPASTDDSPAPALEPAPDPRGPAAPWARDLKIPTEVTYTVRRGGSMKNVANLFKIFHHEITALNPSHELDRELPPNTKIVVYRGDERTPSQSVGLPSHGSLEGGVPMVEGPGRVLKAIPWKTWGTARTVALLDRLLVHWSEHGNGQPVLVGNMSSRQGGKLEPHGTHQSGRDVDLGYIQKLVPGEEHNWREINEANLDPAGTWALLEILVETGAVEVIYIDRSIQKLLYDYALAQELLSERELAAWMEYPRPTGSGNPVIAHVRGHTDHLHVRFTCAEHEKQCRSRHSS